MGNPWNGRNFCKIKEFVLVSILLLSIWNFHRFLSIRWFSGNNTWKSADFRELLPGGQILWEKTWNFLISTAIKAFKMNIHIYTNLPWNIWTYNELWFEGQKNMGSSKNCFPNFRVFLPGIWKYFRKYLRENQNIFENIFGMLIWGLGTIDPCKKIRAKKSRQPF